MPGVKYIAEGFVKDAEKLLKEFVKETSGEFSVFIHFWKKHNFAAIFLGRSSPELQQFTHEIFQLTLKFMLTSSRFHQIGGVYMLYALFRNQVVEPPTRIRIVMKQYLHFLELRKMARLEKYKALHYIIGYLLENGFDLVAHPALVGPRNSKHNMELEKKALQLSCMLKDIKETSLALFESNSLEEIQNMNKAYMELTKGIPFDHMPHDLHEFNIEPHMKGLSKLIGIEKVDPEDDDQNETVYEGIGQRRAQIKSDAFASKAWFRQLNPTDEDEDEENDRFTRSRAQRVSMTNKAKVPKESSEDEEYEVKKVKIKRRRRHRLPKDQRRMGRPRKGQVLEQLLLEDDDVPENVNTKGIRKRGPTARSSYLDRYIEEPFNGASAEIAMLSSSSEEEEENEPEEIITLKDEENVDDPEEITLKEEDVDDPDELTPKEEDTDESEGILTF